ncbi:MAG: hypothetical protein QM635_03275 [Microbacteriaceae bacterium]
MERRMPLPLAVPALLGCCLAVGALLTGCSDGSGSGSASTPSASAGTSPATTSATPTSTATATSSAPATPSASASAETGIAVTLDCAEVITAQQMYDYNSNYTADEDYSPASGSRAAEAVAQKGIACSWVNGSSAQRIVLSVRRLSAAGVAAAEDDRAQAADAVSYGYFTVDGEVGEADAFVDDYWITIDSQVFFEAADAKQLVADAVAALG